MAGVGVELRLLPIDPFDLIRGQYLALRYEINTPPGLPKDVAEGTTVYVVLERGQAGVHHAVSVHPKRSIVSRDQIVIRGVYHQDRRVEYGIENFFMERGAQLKEQMTDLTAYVRILPDGRASVIELRKDHQPVEFEYRRGGFFQR